MLTAMRGVATRALARARGRGGDDGGFVLLETLIAIAMITVIMGAVGAEYVSGLINSDHQRSNTTAVQLADTAVVNVRALHASDLVTGRTSAAVTTERNTLTAIDKVKNWISSDTSKMVWDNTAGATATVPTTPFIQTPGSTAFNVYTYLECTQASTLSADAMKRTCVSTKRTAGQERDPNLMRTVVAVTWNEQGCPNNLCSYVTSTLLSADPDPTFDINQPLPAAPVANQPADQTSAVGDAVSLQLTVKDSTGVLPFTWALTGGSLPSGITYNPAGQISGTVTGTATPAQTVTFTVTDAFLRTSTMSFKWTVLPPLVFTQVSDQPSTTASSANLTLSASGGTGTGYRYSDPASTLPPGLTLNATAGTVTGKPTNVGVYNVTLRVTDSSGARTADMSFTWTVTAPPLAISNPGTQTSSVGKAITALQLSASGGDGNYVFSSTALPDGLSMSASGRITGTPTSAQIKSITVTVTDPTAGSASQTTTFSWTILAAPTITTPPNQADTVGSTVGLTLTKSCSNTPCTYTMANQPNGLDVDSTGKVIGTLAANAVTSTTVTVTIRDAAGATATTSPFTWTVYGQPSVTIADASVVTAEGAVPSEGISYTCANAPCTITLGGNVVPGIGLSTAADSNDNNTRTSLQVGAGSGTVYLTGQVQTTATGSASTSSTSYGMTVTIADSDSVRASDTTSWAARYLPSVTWPGDITVARNGTVSQSVTFTCLSTCSVSITGQPDGVGFKSGSSVVSSGTAQSGAYAITGKVANTTSVGSRLVTVSVTDVVSNKSYTVTSTGTWTVT